MNLSENIKKSIVISLVWLKSKIIENHIAANQEASGRTIRSLLIEETKNGARLTGRNYFSTLETGRKEGKIPLDFNEIIQQWILDKGIPFNPIPYKRQASARWQPKYTAAQRGLMSFAGAIAHKIAKEGTSLYRQGERKDIFTEPTQEAIKQIKDKLTGILKLKYNNYESNS